MDSRGLLLKLIGTIFLFIALWLVGHVSRERVLPLREIKFNKYGASYFGLTVALILFQILNMIACYSSFRWLKEMKLDIAWQGISGFLTLVTGCIWGYHTVKFMIYCRLDCQPSFYMYTVLAFLLTLIAGILFILQAVFELYNQMRQEAKAKANKNVVPAHPLPDAARLSNVADTTDGTVPV